MEKLSKLLCCNMLILSSILLAQTPSGFTVVNSSAAVQQNFTRRGVRDFPAANNYILHFGQISSGNGTSVPVLSGFNYNSQHFIPYNHSSTTPYTRIKLNRIANANVRNLNRFTGFFERSLPTGTGNSGTLERYYKAEYIDNLESLINSYGINRGVDNLFANAGGTVNNVERIDLIIDNGVTVPVGISLAKIGTMILERGGNDRYKVALITSLDSAGNVASLGNLVSRATSNFGATGYSMESDVFQNSSAEPTTADDSIIKPATIIPSQSVSGDFVDFSTLGASNGQVVYGICLFPGDVTASMDLIGLSDVPTNTDDTTNGGLDLMGGGTFFLADDIVPGQVSGNVFIDRDGNSIINGTGIGSIKGNPLFAYLIRITTGEILAKTTVNSNGVYNIPSTILDAGETNYRIIVDTRNISTNYNFTSSNIPSGWTLVGEDFGVGNLAGSGVETGTADLRIPARFNASNPIITNVNFGVAPPVCVKPGASGTPTVFTKVGILTKQSITNSNAQNVRWPENVPNGHIVMDSDSKGFVITHMTTAQRNLLVPVVGMLIYNTDLKCVQLYRGTSPSVDSTRTGWNCLERGCNED